ncbi:hypothetical protein [Actinomadura rubrisoli]|uniref:Uncharacterized protein n=1 Tax=Actinomadura rubrisoli TaxID=2530368 RepID=A0A4R5BNZ3_9ACTN|nr:hypothetical protein [Actinomadura rubrisoli]TDD85634.1 hypothetical protein E1298_18455 [Actinomadura rubrisoli]
MRRIAAIGLAAGTLMTGVAVMSTPANAAVATKAPATAQAPAAATAAAARRWVPYNSYANINAWGTYTRSGGSVYVSGYLQDTKRNGYTACVRFLFKEGTRGYWSRHKIVGVRNGVEYNFDGVAKVKIRASSSYSGHLYVQECGRKKSTGKYYYGKTKRLF